jgi:hypothetical protein
MTHHEVTCSHTDTRDLASYVRGYLAKRRFDSRDRAPRRMSTGDIVYDLDIRLPAWLAVLSRISSIHYTETVTVHMRSGSIASVDIFAECTDAGVQVDMSFERTATGGTQVDCRVRLPSSYRKIPLPAAPLRLVVKRKFASERLRDQQFTDRDAAPAGGGGGGRLPIRYPVAVGAPSTRPI